MEVRRANLSDCESATGLVVAIDVLRAFTTAAYLFDAGVEEVMLVGGVEEAFALRKQLKECLLLGEMEGVPVPGFDLGNSPSSIPGLPLSGRCIIQRTSAGTQGIVRAQCAEHILAAALTNVSATAQYIREKNPDQVTLIQTGLFPDKGLGDEDAACADAIEDQLAGKSVDWTDVVRRVRLSHAGLNFDGSHSHLPPADLELALQIDRFSFAMVVERKNGLHVMRRRELRWRNDE